MKKFLFFLMLLPILLGNAGPNDILASTKLSIVKINYETISGETRGCTGFVVAALLGDVLTAKHCLPEAIGTPIYINEEMAKILKTSDTLALLRITPSKYPALTVRKTNPFPGEKSISFGYAWGIYTVFYRNVAALLGPDLGLDGPITPGMSGGPIIDMTGQVIGINQATSDIVGLACGAGEIREFLEKP